MESWKPGHTEFSAHNAVTVPAEDGGDLERLGRYLLRPAPSPKSLESLTLEPGLRRLPRQESARAPRRALLPLRAARPAGVMHIPAPRLHLARTYGHYAPVSRARRRRAACETVAEGEVASGADSPRAVSLDDEVSRAERRRLRRQWVQLIRRIYESNPLLCTCGAQMRLVSFITEASVISKILEHLERTGSEAARAPPRLEAAPEALS